MLAINAVNVSDSSAAPRYTLTRMSTDVFAFSHDLVSGPTRRALEQLRTISDISRAINSSLRSRDVLAQIVSSAAELLDAQLSWLGEF
jgi:hypothetical protein